MTNYQIQTFIQMISYTTNALRNASFAMLFLLFGAISVYAQNPITTQPSNQIGCTSGGFTAVFSINSISGAIYVWEADTGSGFASVPNTAPFSGVNTNSLSVSNPDGCKGAYTQDLTWYRCRVLILSGPSAGTWLSDSAQLILHTPVTSTDMRLRRGTFTSNTTDSICQGGSTWFRVVNISGACMDVKSSYFQWQVQTPGSGTWTNISSSTSMTDSLVLDNVDTAADGNQYRCRILTDVCTDTFYSDIVRLIVSPTPNAVLGKATAKLVTNFNSAGQSVQGAMFDITPSKGLVVDSLAINLTTGASGKVRIYIKQGTYFNFETSPGAWTLVDSANVTSAGQDNPTSFPVTFPVESDVTYGIYIDASGLTSGQMRHINGVSSFSDDNIFLLNGASITSKWTTFIPSRSWCGIIYYSNGPNFPVNGDTVTVCKGDPVQFGYRISNTIYNGVSSNWRLTHTDPSSSVEYTSPVTGRGDTSYLDEIRTGNLSPGYYTFTLNTVRLTTTANFPNLGCNNTLSESFVIRVLPLPVLTITDVMDPICNGDLLDVAYTVSNGFSGDQFSFTYDVNATSSLFPGTVTGTLGAGGTFSGVFTLADTVLRPPTSRKISFGQVINTTTGCVAGDSVGDSTFRIDPTPLVDITGTPTVCSGVFDPVTGDLIPGWGDFASFSFTTSGTTVGSNSKSWTFYYHVKNLQTGETSTPHSRSGTGNGGGSSQTLLVPDSLFLHYSEDGSPASFRIIIDSLIITSGGGCDNHIPMDSTNFTVNSIPQMTFDVPDSICLGTQLQFFAHVLGVRGTGTADNWQYSYRWDQVAFDPTPYSGPNVATGSDTGTFQETSNFPIATGMWYIWTDTMVNTTTGCFSKPEKLDSFRVDAPSVGGTINGSTTHCEGDNEGFLWLTGYTGDILYWIVSYDEGITWDTVDVAGNAPENRPVSFTPGNDTMFYSDKTYKSRYRAVVRNGACDTVLSSVGGIFLTPQPGVSIANFDNFVCLGDSAELEIVVFNMASSDGWTVYYTQTDSTRSDTFSGVGPGFFTKNVYFLIAKPSTIRIDSIINTNTGCANRYDSTQLVDSVFVYNFTSAGTLTASDTLCRGANSGQLNITGTIGNIQKWQFSTDGGLSWTDINRTDSFYDYLNVNLETDYRVVARNGTCPEDYSDTVTLYMTPSPEVYITGSDTICQGTSATLSVHVDSTYGGDWAVSYQIGSGTDTLTGTGDGTFNLVTPQLGASTTVTLQKIWITNPAGSFPPCANTNISIPASATLTVIPFVSATISSLDDTICSGTSKVVQISINNANVGDTVEVKYSINGSLQAPLTFIGPGSHNFTIPGSSLVATSSPSSTFVVKMDSTRNLTASNACVGFMTDSFTITVDTLTSPGVIADNDTICYGGNGSVEEIAGGTGVIIKWQSRVQGSPTWIDINTTDSLLTFSSLTDTTMYRAVYQSGVCGSAPSNAVTIVPKPLPTATIQALPGYDTVCQNNAAILSLIINNVEAGDSVEITYTQGSTNKVAGSRIVSNPDTIQITTDPIGTNTTVVLKTIKNIDPQGGQPACENTSLTSQVSITVVNQPAISFLNGPDTICQGEDVLFAFIVSNLQTSDNWEMIYELEGDLDTINDQGPGIFFWFDDDPNTAGDAQIIIRSLTNLTNYGCAITDADTWSFYLNENTVAGVIEGPDTLCTGEGTTLREVDTIPRQGKIIRWESRPASSSTWTDMGTADTSITVSSLTETTYYRAIYQNNTCDTVRSNVVEIWVRPLPLATISGSNSICSGDTIDLSITVSNILPGQDWEIKLLEGSTNKTITGTGSGVFPYTVTGTSGTITVTLQEIRATNLNPQCENTSLTNNAVASVTVNQLPSATLTTLADSVCSGSGALGQANINNVVSGQTWKLYWTINTTNLDSTTGTGPGSKNFTTMPLTVNPSIFRLTRIVNTSTGCEFEANDSDVVVVSPPTIPGTLSGSDTLCLVPNSGTIVLSGYQGRIVRWESSIDSGATWSPILSSDTFLNYNNITATTHYRVLVKSGFCPGQYSTVARIHIRPLPIAEINTVGSSVVCEGDSTFIALDIKNVWPTQTWMLLFNRGSFQDTLTGTGSVSDTIFTGPLFSSTTYTLTAINITSGDPMCTNNNLNNRHTTTISVNPMPLATITAAPDTVCKGDRPDITVLVSQVNTGQSWALNYTVRSNSGTTSRSASGAGPGQVTFSIGQLNTEGPVIVKLTDISSTRLGTTCTNDQLNDSAIIFVDSTSIGGTISGPTVACYNSSGKLSVSGYRGDILKWQYSTDGVNYFDIANTSDTFVFTNILAKTWYRVQVQYGVCSAVFSSAFTVDVQALPTVTIGNPTQNICKGDTATLNLTIGNINTTDSWTITYKENGTTKTFNGTGRSATLLVGPLLSTTDIEIIAINVTTGRMCADTSLNEQATLVMFENPNATIVAVPDSLCQGDILVFSVTVNNVQSGTQWELDYDVDGSAGATVSGTGSKTVNINTNRAVSPNQALIELTSIEILSSPFCQSILAEDTTVPVFPTTVGGLITASNNTICEGDDVDLTLTGSVGTVLRWEYSTDSGFTWTVLANNDTFLNPGNLTRTTLFRAFVKSGPCAGRYSSNTITIDVVPTPFADITTSDVVCPGEQATFTLLVSNVRAGHNWEVTYRVDGVLQTTTVTGTGSGNFNFMVPGKPYSGNPTYLVVELESITNTTQNCENTNLTGSAQARVTPNPLAAFSWQSACEDTVVVFQNLSTIVEGSVSNYEWYFGDGDSSNNAEPTHLYDDAGTYQVILVAISDNGCIGRDTQNVVVFDDPTADFNFQNTCLNADFEPTDASTIDNGSIVAWFWDFGDGNTSTMQNPSHRYDVAGNYQVSLTVTSDNGCRSTITKGIVIYVLPDANFLTIPVCEGTAMEFVNTTSIAYGTMRYEWDFAGQGTSFLKDPKFTFTGFGNFNVTLVAVSDKGCGDTITRSVLVHPKPVVDFTVDPVCVGEPSIFQNMSSIPSGTMDEYYWDFGDSTFSGLRDPIHTYPRSGFFPVKLRVVSDFGCSDSLTQQAQVVPLPDVQLVARGEIVFCDGDSVELVANQNARTWRWIGPDSTVITDVDRILAFTEGWYKVTITAPPIGCENSDSIYITVNPRPVAKAWPRDKTEQDRDTISKGATIQLHASGGISYLWMPDEKLNNAFIADPTSIGLLEETVFIVQVTDENGCSDTAKVTVVILDNFDLVVYNVVSPNGDGHNDTWVIENILAYPEADVVILNRYGMEVYNAKGYQNNWAGTTEDGRELPDGAYYYIITHPDFKEPIYTGAINLIRNRK